MLFGEGSEQSVVRSMVTSHRISRVRECVLSQEPEKSEGHPGDPDL